MSKPSKDPSKPTTYKDNVGSRRTFLVLLFDLLAVVYFIGFVSFRIGEIVPMVAYYPHQSLGVFLALALVVGTQFSRESLPPLAEHVLFFGAAATLIYIMDQHLPYPLPEIDPTLYQNQTIVVTGANSGVGFATAKVLVESGFNVIMACRSASRCQKAVDQIPKNEPGRAIPMTLDLSRFENVQNFVQAIRDDPTLNVDILWNNAGYNPPTNDPVNDMGLEPSFTTMHLSPFLLTELLLQDNPQLKAVNTASATHHLCGLPFAALPKFVTDLEWLIPQRPGCLDEEFWNNRITSSTTLGSYPQAKVANIMHMTQLPKHHPQATAIAIDLGWVGTSIIESMNWYVRLGWMRSAATVGILPIMHGILQSVDGDATALRTDKGEGIVVNVFGGKEEAFDYSWWTSNSLSGYDVSQERMQELAEMLWQHSEELVKDYMLI